MAPMLENGGLKAISGKTLDKILTKDFAKAFDDPTRGVFDILSIHTQVRIRWLYWKTWHGTGRRTEIELATRRFAFFIVLPNDSPQ
jgi:hypothetical protein